MANGDGGAGPTGEIIFRGFGLELTLRGAIFATMLLVAPLAGIIALGTIMWRIGERHDTTILAAGQAQAKELEAIKDHVAAIRQQDIMRAAEHQAIVATLSRVSCASWYTPEEKKAIRLRIEEHPSLVKLWCP